MTVTSDLLISLGSIVVISAGLFLLGLRLGSRGRGWVSGVAGSLAVAILITYALWLNDNPVLTHILPVANVLLWGNLQLPAAALLGGVAWSSLRSPIWQRVLLVGVLVGIGLWREAGPLIGRPPVIGAPLGQWHVPANFHFIVLGRGGRNVAGCSRNQGF